MSPSDGPQPIRGSMGATDPGPRNVELDRQNPDIFVPPETDNGSFPNLKFSFSLAHNRLEDGGWAREVTVRDLPVATSMAGVNMDRAEIRRPQRRGPLAAARHRPHAGPSWRQDAAPSAR